MAMELTAEDIAAHTIEDITVFAVYHILLSLIKSAGWQIYYLPNELRL